MVRDKSRMYLDLAILIGIMVVIYYLRVQSSAESFSPFEGLQSIVGLLG